ncbi:GntR family transcriptional regulator [Paracoccus tegillarcae]|uniref:GntR family transcriptional regulator n=1 Tax=Paracoccus tegillarcae TaxID=1529068 RepID=A0A2K9F0Y5_9RHOB|nr:GntR family transcriptional regulator [Paracoccus tegillarcae]AUH34022.1 GntR family transcriptional regulator [Paracoccus tegillarcae]
MTAQPILDFTVSSAVQVYDWLRAAILRGEFMPGDRLSESEIASRFGVSRQPVREAFIRLTSDGLAEVRPQRGTFISQISVSAVLSARLIREAVETDLLRLLVADIDQVGMARLDIEIAEQRVAADKGDAEGFVVLDDRFHRQIAILAGQEGVWTILEGLKSQMNRLRHISARTFDMQKLIAQHAEIVEALRQRDAAQAEGAMRQHLREVLNDLPEITAAMPKLFKP